MDGFVIFVYHVWSMRLLYIIQSNDVQNQTDIRRPKKKKKECNPKI